MLRNAYLPVFFVLNVTKHQKFAKVMLKLTENHLCIFEDFSNLTNTFGGPYCLKLLLCELNNPESNKLQNVMLFITPFPMFNMRPLKNKTARESL